MLPSVLMLLGFSASGIVEAIVYANYYHAITGPSAQLRAITGPSAQLRVIKGK